MAGIEFKDVARLLSCEQFARAEMDLHQRRARCPFHGGEHFNLQFFADGRCYCHVCHKAADVVQLAAAVWNTDQLSAATELNQRFKLGLTSERMTAAEMARRDDDRQRLRDLHEAVKRAETAEWNAACEAERAAQRAMERFTEADADTPAFDQALTRLCAAQLRCEMLQAAMTGGRQQ